MSRLERNESYLSPPPPSSSPCPAHIVVIKGVTRRKGGKDMEEEIRGKVTSVLFSWCRVEIASGHGRDLIFVDFVASTIPVEILGRRNRDTGTWRLKKPRPVAGCVLKMGLIQVERQGSVIIPRIVFPPGLLSARWERGGRKRSS